MGDHKCGECGAGAWFAKNAGLYAPEKCSRVLLCLIAEFSIFSLYFYFYANIYI